jgi:hypothetical protein
MLSVDNLDHSFTSPQAGSGPQRSSRMPFRPNAEQHNKDNLSGKNQNGDDDAEDEQMCNLLGIAQQYSERGSNDSTFHRLPDLKDALMQIGGPSSFLQGLAVNLPPRSQCEDLVEYFFKRLNCIRLPLPQSRIRQSFRSFWNNGSRITFKHLNTVALLTSISAISLLSFSDPSKDAESAFSTSKQAENLERANKLHFASRQILLISSMLSNESLDQIIGWIMCCRFLLLRQRFGEAYTCAARLVKSSFRHKLHRDGTEINQMISKGVTPCATLLSDEEINVRRIIWSAVYHFDRSISLQTGLPYTIVDEFCSTHAPDIPTSSDDVFCVPSFAPKHFKRISFHTPSPYSYCVHRHGLSVFQGRLLLISRGQPTPASLADAQEGRKLLDLQELDKDLSHFESTLPTFFKVSTKQSANLTEEKAFLDQSRFFTFLPVQRYLMNIEICVLRMAIFGPYLLRADLSRAARASCVHSALKTIELDASFKNNPGDLSEDELLLYTDGPQVFQATLICALELYRITKEEEPEVEEKEWNVRLGDANNLSAPVLHFLAERDDQSARTKVEETKIIKLLYDRCEQIRLRRKEMQTLSVQKVPDNNVQGGISLLENSEHTASTQVRLSDMQDITLSRLFGLAEAYQERPEGINDPSYRYHSSIFPFSDLQSQHLPAPSFSDDSNVWLYSTPSQSGHIRLDDAKSTMRDPLSHSSEVMGDISFSDSDGETFWQQLMLLTD